MSQSLIQGKRFFCREWVFSKIWNCLESVQRKSDGDGGPGNTGRNGILILGGAGAGKTALCSEIVSPTYSQGKQRSLRKKLLAHHFCQSHDIDTLSLPEFILHFVNQLSESCIISKYAEKIQEEGVEQVLQCVAQDPDSAFKKLVIYPLCSIEKPKQSCFILVDSIDEVSCNSQNYGNSSSNVPGSNTPSSHRVGPSNPSRTIGELLGNHSHLLPPWLVLVCTARKQSKSLGKLFSGFRRISLDDLRKSQGIRDVQQYILSRLDQDYSLRQHIRRDTAEMLNQLHIKSNGCFLYLEKVLDGISENFIVLREIREIPGTLYGLYLWLCQRLFTKKQFSKVQPILSLLLATRKPLTEDEIFLCLRTKNASMNKEDFMKRMHVLRRVIVRSQEGYIILFHHSFSEWLVDVKYCTQKYLCQMGDGNAMICLVMASQIPDIAEHPEELPELAYHLTRCPKSLMDPSLHSLFLLSTGVRIVGEEIDMHGYDSKVTKLLSSCGAVKLNLVAESVTAGNNEGSLAEKNEIRDAAPTKKERKISDACLEEEGGGEAPCDSGDEESGRGEEALASTSSAVVTQKEREDDEEEESTFLFSGDVNQVDYNQRTPLHNASNDGNFDIVKALLTHQVSLEAVDRHGRTPMNLAARQGHGKVVQALLEAGADVDHADSDGWTPLRSAAWAGHNEVVDVLLFHGAQVDLTDGDGRTALRAAAWGGHEEVVNSLLKAGASPSLADSEGRTPLIAAAYMGHSEIVEKLLNAGANVNHSDSDGRTALSVAALCVAASQGHLKVVSLLLERNAKVDHQDKDGTTPLLVAAFEGHKEVCELLLEYEADVDASDKAGRTPLWAAASMGHASVCELLLFWGAYVDHIDGEGRTVLSVAAAQGSVSVVRLLLDRGLDEGHRDNAGWTPLHYAAFEGHAEVCEVLAESGARINEEDNEGKHALLLASQEGHLNVVATLLRYGADVEKRSHDGRTALRAAAIDGYRDVVQMVVSSGGDVNYRDADGRTTLYLLALENRALMAQFLIRCCADVEARDLEGRTPLHVSAWQGHLEMVELLVSAGAEVNAVDNDRRTPLQSASWQGHANIVRLLCERGSKVDHTCNQGATALCIAAQEGHLECVRVLIEWGANPTHSDRCGRTPIRVAIKSGHVLISKMLEDAALARSKTLLAGSLSMSNWEGLDPSLRNLEVIEQAKPAAASGVVGYNESSCIFGVMFNQHAPLLSPGSTPEADKRRSVASAGGGHGSLKSLSNQTISTKSSQNSEHTQNQSQTQTQRSPNNNQGNRTSSLSKENKNSSKGNQGWRHPGMSFTQQVQQFSRSKGRPGSRLLSPLNEPQSPIYASPPQSPSSDSINDERISPCNNNDFDGIFPRSKNATSPVLSNGCRFQPFAFNRDSHMKIILGNSSDNASNSKGSRKNGVSNSPNSGISSATSAIKSGLNALKAGVLEAAGGRKNQQDDSPLVSAASMAVPNLVKRKGGARHNSNHSNSTSSSSNNNNNAGSNGFVPWKKETPL